MYLNVFKWRVLYQMPKMYEDPPMWYDIWYPKQKIIKKIKNSSIELKSKQNGQKYIQKHLKKINQYL